MARLCCYMAQPYTWFIHIHPEINYRVRACILHIHLTRTSPCLKYTLFINIHRHVTYPRALSLSISIQICTYTGVFQIHKYLAHPQARGSSVITAMWLCLFNVHWSVMLHWFLTSKKTCPSLLNIHRNVALTPQYPGQTALAPQYPRIHDSVPVLAPSTEMWLRILNLRRHVTLSPKSPQTRDSRFFISTDTWFWVLSIHRLLLFNIHQDVTMPV